MSNPIKSFFLFSSGANREILDKKECRVEHNKFAGIGATIFFTAALASLSGGYALFTVFRAGGPAVAFGLFWGLIIFNLDRFIVSSIRKKRAPAHASLAQQAGLKAQELLKALPRLILAIFISIVITRPIELRLFESEIRGQIAKDLTLERTRVERDIRAEYADIEKDEEETTGLRERQVQLENEVTRRVTLAAGELEGWRGTTRRGPGIEYQRRLAEAEQARQELQAFKDQYAPVTQTKTAQVELRKQERDRKLREAKDAVDQSPGLLKRLEAFSTLTTSHMSALLASAFILFLFISLETAPILVKLFSGRGPYEDFLDALEHRAYATKRQEISDLNDEINTSVALSKQRNADRLQTELQLSRNTMSSLHSLAAQELQDAQIEIAREAIARWRAGQLSRQSHTPVTFVHNGGGGIPSAAGNGAGTHAGAGSPAQNAPTQPAGQSAPHVAAPVNAQAPATVGQGSSIP
jgi:Domain of unknown function (DUF4407)